MATQTMEITGYKWPDMDGFRTAEALVNTTLGLPIDPENTTQTSMSAKSSQEPLDPDTTFFYVGEHVQLTPILGAPITFDINVEVPDEE